MTGLNQFTKLKVLQLNGCGLTSLEEFPTLPNLQRLELADNALSDGLDHLQDAALMHLKVLVLAGNKFSSLQGLESLARAPPAPFCGPASCGVCARRRVAPARACRGHGCVRRPGRGAADGPPTGGRPRAPDAGGGAGRFRAAFCRHVAALAAAARRWRGAMPRGC